MTVAELLGVPSATFARKVEVADGALRVERQTEAGYDVVDAPDARARDRDRRARAEPRYPTLKGIMAAKSKPLEQLSLADLGPDRGRRRARATRHLGPEAPEKAAGVVIQAGDDAAAKIAELLAEAKAI